MSEVYQHKRPPDADLPARQLTAQEIKQAEHLLINMSQARSFAQDKQHLSNHQPIAPSSRLRALNPFLDPEQLLRVGGRLSNSALSAAQRNPIILDSRDILVTLMFNHMHVCLGHCGPSLLMCSTGWRFHMMGARRLSRTVCSQCKVCRKISAKAQSQQLADLPADRVTKNPAFAIVGVDYAGPFLLKKGHTRKPVTVKCNLAVFVCFCTKAIHLEAVTELTTEAFIACLKRFISRRGCPATIHSDNGSNFKGAKADLQELYRFLSSPSSTSAVAHYLLSQHIQWSMIPERSPHFGGLWEAAVKAAKHHIRRIVGPQKLTYEKFSTTICQVEACLNSRPLLAITSHDTDGVSTLTPGHFLVGRPLTAYPSFRIQLS